MNTTDEGNELEQKMENTKNSKHENENSYRNQILMVCLINMPMLEYGTAVAWLSPMAVLLQSKDTPASQPFTDEEVSWMAGILFLSAVFGTLLFSVIVDRIGRKKSSILASIPFLICWSLKLISTKPWVLTVARGIAGVATGGGFFLAANYVKEVSDDEISGALGASIILFMNGGCFLITALSEVFGYYTILYLCLSIPVIHIVLFVFMPESPMYLIKCGKKHEALKVMAWLKNTSIKDEGTLRYFNQKKAEIENEHLDSGDSVISIITSKTMAKPVRLTWILVVMQEASGCLAVLLYAGTIFDLANRTGGQNFVSRMTPNMQSIFVGILQVTGSILSVTLVEKCGRRVRNKLAAPIYAFTWFVDFLFLKFFTPVANAFGIYTAFWIFTGILVSGFIYVLALVPETKGRSYEEINDIINGRKAVPQKDEDETLRMK